MSGQCESVMVMRGARCAALAAIFILMSGCSRETPQGRGWSDMSETGGSGTSAQKAPGIQSHGAPPPSPCPELGTDAFGQEMAGSTAAVLASLSKRNHSLVAYPNGQQDAIFAISGSRLLLGDSAPREFVLTAPPKDVPLDGEYIIFLGSDPDSRIPSFAMMGILGVFPIDASTGNVSRYCIDGATGTLVTKVVATSVDAFVAAISRPLGRPSK